MLGYKEFVKKYLEEADANAQTQEQNKTQEQPKEITDKEFQIVFNWFSDGKGNPKEVAELLKRFNDDTWKRLLTKDGNIEQFKKDFQEGKFDYNTKNGLKFFNVMEHMSRMTDVFNDKDVVGRFLHAINLKNEEYGQILKKMTEQAKWSFDSALRNYETLGEIITYKSVEVMFKNKDTKKIDPQDLMYGMKNAFKTEDLNYLDNLQNIEQKMTIDAALGVLEEREKRQKESTDYNQYVMDILNEADTSEFTVKTLQGTAEKDPKEAYQIAQQIKKQYPKEFQTKYEALMAKFDEGRKKIIEDEKSDKEKDFKDPVTGKIEKRVGRLGHYGPMTYIKNHEDLNKAVDAIDKQQWNIFNCAAKLLIKFFKLIEHGEMKWQEFMEDIRKGKQTALDGIMNDKIPDFNNKYEEIANEELPEGKDQTEHNNEKIIKLVELYSGEVRKYQQVLVDSFDEHKDDQLIKFNEENGALIANQQIIEIINNNQKNLASVNSSYDAFMKAIKTVEDSSAKAETEEPQQEAPQQNASYSNDAIANLSEADVESPDNTAEMVNDTAEQSKKEQDQKQAQEGDKKTEKKKVEKLDWRNQKFKFSENGIGFDLKSLQKDYDSGLYSTKAESIEKIAENVKNDKIKNTFLGIAKLIKVISSKNENRLLTLDELLTNSITAGEMVGKTHNLFEALKGIDVSGFEENLDNLKEFIQFVNDTDKTQASINLLNFTQKTENKEQNTQNDAEAEKLAQGGINQIKDVQKILIGTDQNNVKKAITELKQKKDNIVKAVKTQIETYYKNTTNKNFMNNAAKILKTKNMHLIKTIQEKGSNLDNMHIVPAIWVGQSFLSQLSLIGTVFESKIGDQAENSIKMIAALLPADANSDVYKLNQNEWYKKYEEFTNAVATITKEIEAAKDKLTEEILPKVDNIKTADDFIKFLQSDNDPLYKLELISGLNLNDEEKEENNEEKKEGEEKSNEGETDNGNKGEAPQAISHEQNKEVAKTEALSPFAAELYKYLRG